ncbi:MFS transporter [Nocardia sp. NPDC050378]|uniref:MFS transporter n=1 Tax=Nocardia sp. NPDC050378 TaxID=3155400 RepID=UPI0033DCCFB8
MTTSSGQPPTVNEAEVRKVAMVSLVGASVEWFDFFLFGTAAALVFPTLFFPSTDPVTGVLVSFGVFGIGFIARPVGGVVWGHFGDRVGRKKAFIAALGLMAVASALIGLLPTYATIGIAAPIALTLLRFAQGVAVGGQWGGAALLATESAPAHKRGFYGSFAQLGVPIGVLLGVSAYFLLSVSLGAEAFRRYGWRIPFVVSILFVGVVLYVHHRLEETPAFRNLQRAAQEKAATAPSVGKSPVIEVLRSHWKRVVLAGGAFIVVNATFYLYITFMLDYGTRTLKLTMADVLGPLSMATLLLLGCMPVFAALSDRVGRRPLYTAGAILTALWAFPFFTLVDTKTFLGMTAGLAVGMTFLTMMYGPLAAFFGELFPPEVRYSGASLGYQLGSVIGGAATPLIAVELLDRTGSTTSLSLMLVGLSLLAVVCIRLLASMHSQDGRD